MDHLLKAGKGNLVDFMVYPGEFHYFDRSFVVRDAWQRVDAFFKQNLRPEVMPACPSVRRVAHRPASPSEIAFRQACRRRVRRHTLSSMKTSALTIRVDPRRPRGHSPRWSPLGLFSHGAFAQRPTTTRSNPVGVWRGTSRCLVRPSPCNDEVVVYRIAREGAADSLLVDGRKIVNGREDEMGVLGCRLNPSNAQLTCIIPNGAWRFTVRGDSMIGELRLPDSTTFRDGPDRARFSYDHFRSTSVIGRVRMRLPVAAKIALQTAGAAAGSPGSPNPVGGATDLTN